MIWFSIKIGAPEYKKYGSNDNEAQTLAPPVDPHPETTILVKRNESFLEHDK